MRRIPALSGWGPPRYRTWVTLQSTTHMELFVPHSLNFFMTRKEKKIPGCVSWKQRPILEHVNGQCSPQCQRGLIVPCHLKHGCGLVLVPKSDHWPVFIKSSDTTTHMYPDCTLISSSFYFHSSSFCCSTMSPSFLTKSEHGMSSWHWTPRSRVSVDSTLSKDNMGQRFPLTGRLRPCWGSPPDGEQTKKSWLKTAPRIHSPVVRDMSLKSTVSQYRWEKQEPTVVEVHIPAPEADVACSAESKACYQE